MTADKQQVRERTWAALREAGVARFPGVEGRIPNFVGAEAAAERLAGTEAWRSARVVKCNPDSPQLPVRKRALVDGKTIYMAVPKLADPRPFWRLDPDRLDAPVHEVASIKGAATYGEPVSIGDVEAIDLIVCGSVAVEKGGARVGKGGGFSDLEFALLAEQGRVGARTVIATTVHPSQVVPNGTIPVTGHDFPVDLVVTPDWVIETETRLERPQRVIDQHLDPDKRAAIPILAER